MSTGHSGNGQKMHRQLREQLKEATHVSGNNRPDLVALLKIINDHYDQIDETLTESRIAAAPAETIFDSVTVALFSVTENGTILNCNRVCTKYFGIARRDLFGMSFAELVPAAEDQSMDAFLAPYLTNLDESQYEIGTGEVTAMHQNGNSFVAQISASCMDDGIQRIYVISLRDITERKEAERTLKENEERYRALIENAPEAIVVIDVDSYKFCDANDKACELFNLSRKRLLSVGPKDVSAEFQADGSPSFGTRRGYMEQTLDGETPVFEWLHLDADGREVPCEIRMSRLPSSDRRLVRALITDISDRKRSEALAFAENKILEMIAAHVDFSKTLRTICRSAEEIGEGLNVAIMARDMKRNTLRVEQAPGMPDELAEALHEIPADENGLSCAAAVANNRPKIDADVSQSPGWKPHLELLERAGLNSVWSFPVVIDGEYLVGTMDFYGEKTGAPTTAQLDVIAKLVRLTGIAAKRKIDEDLLKRSETRYRGLFENVVDGVYISSRDGEIIAVNPALVEMLGYEDADDLKAAGSTSQLYVNDNDRDRVFAALEDQGFVRNFESRLRRKDGREIVILENSRAIRDENGKVVGHEGTITDITERKVAETRIFQEKERAQVTLQSIGDGVITTDADGMIDYINPVAQQVTGCETRLACGKPIDHIMTIVNEQTRATIENPSTRCLKEGRLISLAENSLLVTQEGNELPIQISAAPIRDRLANITGSVIVFHDISRESRLFRQLAYQASHDALTDLINRREFENRLVDAIDACYANPEETCAMLYVDLDQFKVVNDTFGHIAGDELLRKIAKLLQSKIRSTDVIARLSGDEFGILLSNCNETRAFEVAESIRSAIEEYRFTWKEVSASIRCSIGIVMVNCESEGVAAVMSSADVACYSAKDMGRNQVHIYQDTDVSARHEEMKWASRITSAVEENRFQLHYQPIVGIGDSADDGHRHYELLLRMRGEDGRLVQPDLFIPAAERYNLMSMLDRWVIREALEKLADHTGEDGKARYTLAINLSGNSLSEDRFLDFLLFELNKMNLPRGALCFEITETAAISNLARVVHFMNSLKELGCLFSLDDFGSGLSSFTYLKNLPVDFLKIDGHFISNVAQDVVDQSMVKAIAEVGSAMGIKSIAERVESPEVMEMLAELGVNYVQGFHIARPTSTEGFEPWVEASAGEGRKLA